MNNKKSSGAILGAAFLMATSAIGPGFLTQTATFTNSLGASFGFVILVSVLMAAFAQVNIWRVLCVSGLRGQDVANKVLPGLGYVLAALIVIGGNGSLSGAEDLAREHDVTVIGLPGTIDNDLYGTDSTIGYDTALNTIVDCVDKIRDTATSHDRIFFVEVMGRDAGFLTQNSAIASGAEAAIIPEDRTDIDQLAQFIGRGIRKSKNSSIVLVSESKKDGGAMHYAERVRKEYPEYDVRVTILGHLQRGGRPSAYDRILASRMGVAAVEALKEGQRNIMVGVKNDQIVYVPISKAIKIDKPLDPELINVLTVLSI